MDSQLRESGSRTVLRVDLTTTFLRVSPTRALSTLQLFEAEGILYRDEVFTCADDKCGQLVPGQAGRPPVRCSSCDGDAFTSRPLSMFRVTKLGASLVEVASGGLPTGIWPGSVASLRGRIHVVLVSVINDEFQALLERVPTEVTVTGRRPYNLSRVRSAVSESVFNIATLRQVQQGTGEAQAIVRDIIDDLAPRLIVFVGIAGGIPEQVTLGDVVFSNHVHDLTVHSVAVGGTTTYSTSGGPVEVRLQAALANLAVSLPPGLNGIAFPDLPPAPSEDGILSDAATGSAILADFRSRYGDPAKARTPRFVDGPIASSDALVKDPELLKVWRSMLRHLLAVEMETAGAYRGVRGAPDARTLLFSIRAISDVVGLARDDGWKRYACSVAAGFALGFIRSLAAAPEPGA